MIQQNSIFTPEPGTLLDIRLTDKARTTHNWSVRLQSSLWVPSDRRAWSVRIEGQLQAAAEATGIDQRLDNQRASIDRLLKHLEIHCPRLSSGSACEHWS